MKWIAIVLGGLLALTGFFWILQGTGIVPLGGMANQIQFAVFGAVLILIGAALAWWSNRRKA